MADSPYPIEVLDEEDDDGTIVENVNELKRNIIGARIVSVKKAPNNPDQFSDHATIITLDNGKRVKLIDTSDCCAGTWMQEFLLHPELVDHTILGVGTTEGYTKWHIFADLGDILELTVDWSCGNPFYYGYGFDILVEEDDAACNGLPESEGSEHE